MDNESFIRVDVFGNKFWLQNGIYHRLDGPAIESTDGGKSWYINGELHREDGPAVIYNNGTSKEWFKYGELHRDDGPAIENSGVTRWYKNGLLHRLDGPAIVCANGERLWYKNGRRFKNKDAFFSSLTKKQKEAALFSVDFLNG
jgi:hypothetical protein